MWVKFSDRKPKEGEYEEGNHLITRSPGLGGGDAFETWRIWKNSNIRNIGFIDDSGKITGKISHWWDGESNMDLAVKEWFNEKD